MIRSYTYTLLYARRIGLRQPKGYIIVELYTMIYKLSQDAREQPLAIGLQEACARWRFFAESQISINVFDVGSKEMSTTVW